MKIDRVDNEIVRVVNGSKLYGLDTEDSDDDYIAIYVESPEYVFSNRTNKTINLSEVGAGVRNGPGDTDGQAYALRHFISLALKGNPTILTLLFVPEDKVVFEYGAEKFSPYGHLVANRDSFMSKKAGRQFLGYMNNQLERMKGIKAGHKPNRPWLIEKYGYDTKYCYQIARLGLQGIELMALCNITLPMENIEKEFCMKLRDGYFVESEAMETLEGIQTLLEEATSSLKTSRLQATHSLLTFTHLSTRIFPVETSNTSTSITVPAGRPSGGLVEYNTTGLNLSERYLIREKKSLKTNRPLKVIVTTILEQETA